LGHHLVEPGRGRRWKIRFSIPRSCHWKLCWNTSSTALQWSASAATSVAGAVVGGKTIGFTVRKTMENQGKLRDFTKKNSDLAY